MNILITGCSRGIGKSLFSSLSKIDNVNVFPHFRVGVESPSILIGDLNDPNIDNKIESFINRNSIDVFINNASIYQKKPSSYISSDDIHSMINSNVTNQLIILSKVVKLFKNKPSKIININSIAAKNFSSEEALYCVTKNATGSFLNCISRDIENSKIGFTNIYLGATKTDMTRSRSDYDKLIDPEELGNFLASICSYPTLSFGVTELEIRRK